MTVKEKKPQSKTTVKKAKVGRPRKTDAENDNYAEHDMYSNEEDDREYNKTLADDIGYDYDDDE